MRCPRCLRTWDPDYVELDAEHAECRPCGLVVALAGLVLPEWERPAVAEALDTCGSPPALDVAVSELVEPRSIVAKRRVSVFSPTARLHLGREGARAERTFRRPVALPLAEIARFAPAVDFAWERDPQRDSKWLVPTPQVIAIPRGGALEAAPMLVSGTWEAARYVAARFERVRRALTDTGAYR